MEGSNWREVSQVRMSENMCKILNEFRGHQINCNELSGLLLSAESRAEHPEKTIVLTIREKGDHWTKQSAFTYEELSADCVIDEKKLSTLISDAICGKVCSDFCASIAEAFRMAFSDFGTLIAHIYEAKNSDAVDDDVTNQEHPVTEDVSGDSPVDTSCIMEKDLCFTEHGQVERYRMSADVGAGLEEFFASLHGESNKTTEKVKETEPHLVPLNASGSYAGSSLSVQNNQLASSVDKNCDQGHLDFPNGPRVSAVPQAAASAEQCLSSLPSWPKLGTELDWNAMSEEDLCKFLNVFQGHQIEYGIFCGMQNYTGTICRCRPIGKTILLVVETPQGSCEYISSTYAGVFNGCLFDGKNLSDFISQAFQKSSQSDDNADATEAEDKMSEDSYEFGNDIESVDSSKTPTPRTPSPEMPELEPYPSEVKNEFEEPHTGWATLSGTPVSLEADQPINRFNKTVKDTSDSKQLLMDTMYLADLDVYLVSKDNVKHGAHKLVLGARSSLFKTVFKMADPGVPHKEIIMDYSSGVLQAFLQLIYAQPCPGLQEHLVELVEIFGEFGLIGDLADMAGEEQTFGAVTPENAAKLFFTAVKHRQFRIWKRAVEVLLIHKDVREGEEFQKLKNDGLFLNARGIEFLLKRT